MIYDPLCRKYVDEALFSMIYDDCHILAIVVNHGNSRKFMKIAMIYIDCHILAIDVNHGKRRKFTTISTIYDDCQILSNIDFYVKSKVNFLI